MSVLLPESTCPITTRLMSGSLCCFAISSITLFLAVVLSDKAGDSFFSISIFESDFIEIPFNLSLTVSSTECLLIVYIYNISN